MARRAWQYAIGPGGFVAAYDILRSRNKPEAYGNILKANVKSAVLTGLLIRSLGQAGKFAAIKHGLSHVELNRKLTPAEINVIPAEIIDIVESYDPAAAGYIDEVVNLFGEAIPYLE